MNKTILVVEDELLIVDSLAEILQSAGYEVLSAYSGEEALNKAASVHPDILLSDVLMPAMNGFELALEIKRLHPSCRLLFFSGQAATARLAQGFIDKFSGLGYHFELLPKPIHPAVLLQSVENALVGAG